MLRAHQLCLEGTNLSVTHNNIFTAGPTLDSGSSTTWTPAISTTPTILHCPDTAELDSPNWELLTFRMGLVVTCAMHIG